MKTYATITAIVVALTLASPATGQDTPATFVNIEYWTCPEQNMPALTQALDSIWGPIMNELVAEDQFESWGTMTPVQTVDYQFASGSPTREEIAATWNFAVYWRAENKVRFDEGWGEFQSRLAARFPDVPTPARFCNHLTIVKYTEQSRSG